MKTHFTSRLDRIELSQYKTTADIDLLFDESLKNKRDIAQLKDK